MQLTRFTDLALRVLLYVGRSQAREERVTIAETARFYHVSHEHLRKVVHRLAGEGLLVTAQGRRGGLQLARPADRIRIGEVVECMEPDMAVVDCAAQECILRGSCSLKGALSDAGRAFVAVLNGYTLADLLRQPAMRARLTRVA